MKKVLAKIAGVVLAALVLTSCGSELSEQDKALNMYKNTTSIVMGSMVAMMPMGAEAALEEMVTKLDQGLELIKKEKPEIFKKLSENPTFMKGAAIAPKGALPDGLKPLTEDLSTADLMAYIEKNKDAQELPEGDVYGDYMKEVGAWLGDLSQDLQQDEELVKALRGE